jgi:hypothetical protein
METIRDCLLRRQITARILGWIICVAVLFAAFKSGLGWGPFGSYVVAILAILVFVLWLLNYRLVRCPRCDAPFQGTLSPQRADVAEKCHGCGANLRDPVTPNPRLERP